MPTKRLLPYGIVALLWCALVQDASAQGLAKAAPREDLYHLQRAQADTAHASEHARLAEEFLDTGDQGIAAKEHARAIRQGISAARRSYSMLSDVSKQNAEIAAKLAEIAAAEEKLLATADRIDPPVVLPLPYLRVDRLEMRESKTRIPQSYYRQGEGHFID